MVPLFPAILDFFSYAPSGTTEFSWTKFSLSIFCFAIICCAIFFTADKLVKKEYGARFLFGTACLVFACTLLGTYGDQMQRAGYYLGVGINFIKYIIGIVPIGFSIYLCRNYWESMEKDVQDNGNYTSIYPTLMVAQGTFYTFVGVAAILFSYDAGQENAVTMLLSGLKLAFITSIIGLAYSIAAKNYLKKEADTFFQEKRKKVDASSSLDEIDFYQTLSDIKSKITNIKTGIGDSYTQLKSITSTLSWNNRTAEEQKQLLKEQSQLLGSQNTLLEETLTEAMKNAGEVLVKKNNEVLSSTIESFRQMIVETQKSNQTMMNQIFQDHKKMHDTMMDTFSVTLSAMEDSMSQIDSTLKSTQTNVSTLNTKLESTNIAVEVINQSILELKEPIEKTNASLTTLHQNTEDIANKFAPLTEKYNDIEESLLENIEAFKSMQTVLQQLNQDISTDVENTVTKSLGAVSTMSNSITSTMNSLDIHMKNLRESIQEQSDAINEYSAQLKLVSQDASTQDKIIKNGHDAIVKEYGLIVEHLTALNSGYNNQMLDAQKKYNDMMSRNLSDCISIVSDVLRSARDRYVKDISSMDVLIKNLQKDLNNKKN